MVSMWRESSTPLQSHRSLVDDRRVHQTRWTADAVRLTSVDRWVRASLAREDDVEPRCDAQADQEWTQRKTPWAGIADADVHLPPRSFADGNEQSNWRRFSKRILRLPIRRQVVLTKRKKPRMFENHNRKRLLVKRLSWSLTVTGFIEMHWQAATATNQHLNCQTRRRNITRCLWDGFLRSFLF